MAYLDPSDVDSLAHLIQLFLGAHPAYRQSNDAMRAREDMPGQYFLSLPMTRELAVWARQRHLITRAAAARMVEVATHVLAGDNPASIVSLTPRMMGTPPRLQPTVLSTEMFRWLFLQAAEAEAGEEVLAFTVAAAIQVLQGTATDAEMSAGIQARARQLIAWLQAQDER